MQGLSPLPPRPQNRVDIDPDVPAYQIIEKRGFFDDQDNLWPKGSMIYWEGTPSMAFDPLNELAHEKMREYLQHLDDLAVQVDKQKGSSHASIVEAYTARRRIQEMDRRSGRSIDHEAQMPIMGAKQYNQPRARSVEAGSPRPTPMMGHQGRYSVAPQAAKGNDLHAKKTLSLKNEGRDAVNKDDKGLG